MKKIFLLIATTVFFCTTFALAASYKDLKPGVSTKADADRILGNPIKEVVKDALYDYSPEGHDARRLAVNFNPQTKAIIWINLDFLEDYSADKLREWFSLSGPGRIEYDPKSHRIEYYDEEGIVFYFKASEENSAVTSVHFIAGRSQDKPQALGQAQQPAAGKFSYLGVQMVDYEGPGIRVLTPIKDSPAERAGIESGDIIIKVGDYNFDMPGAKTELVKQAISSMPAGKPIPLQIQRQGKTFEYTVYLEERSQEELKATAEKNKNTASQSYLKGRQYQELKEFNRAIESYREAIRLDAIEPKYYQALGSCYYQCGDFWRAIESYKNALTVRPEYESFFQLGKIYTEKNRFDDGLAFLRRAEHLCAANCKDYKLFEQLSVGYYEKNLLEDCVGAALQAYRLSGKRSALGAFYLAVCFDRTGNSREAMAYFNRFLQLKPNDAKREVFARRRLQQLRQSPQYMQQQNNMQQSMQTLLNEISKELGKFEQQ